MDKQEFDRYFSNSNIIQGSSDDPEVLMNYLAEKGHPALEMEPMM